MPGFALHVGATVLCAHAGQAQAASTYPRVKVGGQPVAVQPFPWLVSGCALPPDQGVPCLLGQWLTGAVRVRAGGMPPLLQDSQSVCTPTGTPLTVVMAQPRVRAQ